MHSLVLKISSPAQLDVLINAVEIVRDFERDLSRDFAGDLSRLVDDKQFDELLTDIDDLRTRIVQANGLIFELQRLKGMTNMNVEVNIAVRDILEKGLEILQDCVANEVLEPLSFDNLCRMDTSDMGTPNDEKDYTPVTREMLAKVREQVEKALDREAMTTDLLTAVRASH